jgi:hypothetical protein
LGINRRTVARLLASDEPPSYRRAPIWSQLDPLEPVLRRLLEEWPRIKAPRLTEILRESGLHGIGAHGGADRCLRWSAVASSPIVPVGVPLADLSVSSVKQRL